MTPSPAAMLNTTLIGGKNHSDEQNRVERYNCGRWKGNEAESLKFGTYTAECLAKPRKSFRSHESLAGERLSSSLTFAGEPTIFEQNSLGMLSREPLQILNRFDKCVVGSFNSEVVHQVKNLLLRERSGLRITQESQDQFLGIEGDFRYSSSLPRELAPPFHSRNRYLDRAEDLIAAFPSPL